MNKRIEFLKTKLQTYQEELDRLREEEEILKQINELEKEIIAVKLSKKENKKTYNQIKKEEVLRELEKTDYRKFQDESGRTYFATSNGEFFSETKRLKKHICNGYEYVSFSGKAKLVHRVMWEIFKGKIPNGMEIDHIDCDRLNNAIDNLRVVTSSENKRNPITIEHYKEANKNKGIIRMRNEKKLSENLEF